ncbi:MAG: zf-HC2 domain-containing protein [Thermoanaerobaculia bacterium]|nr:zf-HC2 domain-containing protein [Thermoanaerobaculia bacterium]
MSETATPASRDHSPFFEWLTLEGPDASGLAPSERRRLEEHLAGCAVCRQEREHLHRLDRLIAAEALPVRASFRQEILNSLPAAGWEGRSPRAWVWPVAAMLALGVAAAALLGASSTRMAPGASFLAALTAIGDLFLTGLLAGTGLLSASWRGLGLVLDRALTPSSTAAFALLVISIDVLLVSMVLRRRRARASATTSPTHDP